MWIYATVVTAIAVIFIVKFIKWKVATYSILMFCIENFREPTDEEIADCTKLTVSNLIKGK